MAADVGKIVVGGGFDDLGIRHLRLLHESSRMGEVTVLLWSDEVVRTVTGALPKFSLAERQYLVGSLAKRGDFWDFMALGPVQCSPPDAI